MIRENNEEKNPIKEDNTPVYLFSNTIIYCLKIGINITANTIPMDKMIVVLFFFSDTALTIKKTANKIPGRNDMKGSKIKGMIPLYPTIPTIHASRRIN